MLANIEKVLFLKGIALFAQIPGEDLSRVAQIAQEEHFGKGTPFIRQGDIGDCLYLIVDGEVKIIVDGREVAKLGEKQCVGEMSILDSEPRSATVEAATDVRALKIERDDFYELLSEKIEIAQGIIKVLTHRLREANLQK